MKSPDFNEEFTHIAQSHARIAYQSAIPIDKDALKVAMRQIAKALLASSSGSADGSFYHWYEQVFWQTYDELVQQSEQC